MSGEVAGLEDREEKTIMRARVGYGMGGGLMLDGAVMLIGYSG